jgi:hypothetical protein
MDLDLAEDFEAQLEAELAAHEQRRRALAEAACAAAGQLWPVSTSALALVPVPAAARPAVRLQYGPSSSDGEPSEWLDSLEGSSEDLKAGSDSSEAGEEAAVSSHWDRAACRLE